jgi:hypothetical protein
MIIELANDKIKGCGKGNDIEGKSLLDIMHQRYYIREAREVRATGIPFHGVDKEPKNMHGNLKKSIFQFCFPALFRS